MQSEVEGLVVSLYTLYESTEVQFWDLGEHTNGVGRKELYYKLDSRKYGKIQLVQMLTKVLCQYQ